MEKVFRVTEFNQNDWLKTHIDMNADLQKWKEIILEKTLFKLMNHAVSLYTYKQMMSIKTLEKVLKLDLILQFMN